MPDSFLPHPQRTIGASPAEPLIGRKLRSRLDLVRPNSAAHAEEKQQRQKEAHNQTASHRDFLEGDVVYARSFGRGEKWVPGRKVKRTGPLSFTIQLEQGHVVWRRHQDQIRKQYDVEPLSLTEDITQESSGMPNATPAFAIVVTC